MIKSNKENTLNSRETYFLYRKPQKLKIAINVFRKSFSKKFLNFFFSVSHIVSKKNEKWPAIAEIINYGFPLKWAKMN